MRGPTKPRMHRCRLTSGPQGLGWPALQETIHLVTGGLARLEPLTGNADARLVMVRAQRCHIVQAELPPIRLTTEEADRMLGLYTLEHSPWWVTAGGSGGTEVMHAPGEVLLAAPGRMTAVSRARGRITGLWVPIDRLTVSGADLARLRHRPLPLPAGLRSLLPGAVEGLAGAGELDPHGAENYLAGLADLIVRSLLGIEAEHEEGCDVRRQQIRDYIHRRLDDPGLDVDSIAAAHNISRSALYLIFEDEDGVAGYVRRHRLVRAKEMLADPRRTNETIGAIARQAGFTSPAHFSRVFSRAYGARPSEFRGR